MWYNRVSTLTGMACFLAACILAAGPAAAQRTAKVSYKITDMGLNSSPTAIDGAFVAGHQDTVISGQAMTQAIRWKIDNLGVVVDTVPLGCPVGSVSVTVGGVNGSGLVVGTARISGFSRAFVAISQNQFVDLGYLPFLDPGNPDAPVDDNWYASSAAYDINNQGEVVGQSIVEVVYDTTGVGFVLCPHGAYWKVDQAGNVTKGPIDLGRFIPTSINDGGVMAGFIINDPSKSDFEAATATLVDGKAFVTRLGWLSRDFASKASAINFLGDVVGESRERSGVGYIPHAFVDTASAPMVELLDLGGGQSYAKGINDAGLVVGMAARSGRVWQDIFRAALWTNGSTAATDLNTASGAGSLGWYLRQASAINGAGQIVGSGSLTTKQGATDRGFLLTPLQ